ncbi:LysR family transcriptional regulator [Phaeovibrio sulfidiphilus]|uniref:LysR family transcriptional regulator n=1 Tax=Phaeovibrio sulfidiphilus TaxID=1220600 RepID=A0A8J6YNZ6_9PROT|nr:LysR family transcriptional regulator [Phaeovibrio sulfidiphilus]MBE1236502.1 LysR family transcriptional regulator [Phaeovibrio sulfidiphilus]
MDPRHLKSFLQIMETGSFSAAAERIELTQPALSRQISILEQEVGETLFRRTGRGAEPTEAGLLLAEHARSILDSIEAARHAMASRHEEVMGRVAVGLPPSIGVRLTAPLVDHFRHRHPLVHLCVVEELSGFVQDGLLAGWIDTGILYAQTVHPALFHEPLMTEELMLISHPDLMPDTGSPNSPVPIQALAELPVLMPSRRHGMRSLIDQALLSHRMTLNTAIETDSLRVSSELAKRKLGVFIHAPSAFERDLKSGALVARPLGTPPLKRAIVLAWPRDRAPTRATLAMADAIREMFDASGGYFEL